MAQSVATARIGSFRFFSARAILAQCLGTAHRATAPHSANCRARRSQFCSEVADGVSAYDILISAVCGSFCRSTHLDTHLRLAGWLLRTPSAAQPVEGRRLPCAGSRCRRGPGTGAR